MNKLLKKNSVKVVGLTICFSFFCSVNSTKAQLLDLADIPVTFGVNVPPNVIVSFDDSLSMMWGYMPDEIWFDQASGFDPADYHATKSSYYNKIYYDPNITYKPPMNAAGVEYPDADFNDIDVSFFGENGRRVDLEDDLDTNDSGSINLVSEFRPLWNMYANDDNHSWGPRYAGSIGSAHYYERDPDCTGGDLDNTCYTKKSISVDEETNFANWFQYYSYRIIAGKSALSRAFIPTKIDASTRVARQTINDRNRRVW